MSTALGWVGEWAREQLAGPVKDLSQALKVRKPAALVIHKDTPPILPLLIGTATRCTVQS